MAYTSQSDESFFGAIGRMTISWAYLELGLDWTINNLYLHFNAVEVEKQQPRNLDRKLAFMRAVIKRMPLPEEFARGFALLFESIKSAAETRHDIIHGFIIKHEDGTGEATFSRIIRGEQWLPKSPYKLTARDIMEAAIEADRLSSKTLKMAAELQDLIDELRQQRDAQAQS